MNYLFDRETLCDLTRVSAAAAPGPEDDHTAGRRREDLRYRSGHVYFDAEQIVGAQLIDIEARTQPLRVHVDVRTAAYATAERNAACPRTPLADLDAGHVQEQVAGQPRVAPGDVGRAEERATRIVAPFVESRARERNGADRDLDGLAQIYRLGWWRHVRHVLAPHVAPYGFAALRNAHALAWKVIIAIEIFAAAKAGFGAQFSYAWTYFLMVEVHLWLIVFMSVVLIAEYGVLRPAERYVFRWRDGAA